MVIDGSKLVEDGTTCIFSTVQVQEVDGNKQYKCIVGNIGDSRVVLARDGTTAISMTEDHKPDNLEEEERIKAAGGFVKYSRVRGNLALSRAIGDRSYKVPEHFTPDKYQVLLFDYF